MPLTIKFIKAEALVGKDFIESVSQRMINNLQKKIANQIENIQNIIRKNVRFSLGINFVMKSLKNSNSTLVASLGLNEEIASIAYSKILDIVDSIKYDIGIEQQSIKSGGKIKVTVRLPSFNEYLDKFDLNLFPFQYASVSQSDVYGDRITKIKWLEWLFNNASQPIDKGGFKWSILYGNYNSRSKRAIMIPNYIRKKGKFVKNPKFTTPYVLPSVLIPKGSAKNFIDEVFKSNRLAKLIKTDIQIRLNEILISARK